MCGGGGGGGGSGQVRFANFASTIISLHNVRQTFLSSVDSRLLYVCLWLAVTFPVSMQRKTFVKLSSYSVKFLFDIPM